MAIVTDYYCDECGLELADDGRLFYYDEESQECVDYLLLMSTVSLDEGSKIRGHVNEIYCRNCDRFLRVYTIREVDGIENPCETVERGIANRISHFKSELKRLEEIRDRETYVLEKYDDEYCIVFPEFEDYEYYGDDESEGKAIENAKREFHAEIDGPIQRLKRKIAATYVVVNQSDKPDDYRDESEKVMCPECGRQINKFIVPGMPCPKCGNEYFFGFTTCYD